MSKGLAFWIVYLLAVVLSLVFSWPIGWGFSSTIVIFILFLLLGWQVFGAPIKG